MLIKPTISLKMEMPEELFSVDTNPKTIKGVKYGFRTMILYMAPSNLSGYQTCPMASLAQCENACLNTAGKGAMNSVQESRIRKTWLFMERRDAFMTQVVKEIRRNLAKSQKEGLTLLVRMNGTSDIRWESIPVTVDGVAYQNIMAVFPNVQFYDYTKLPNRKGIPSNYDLTFSYSGTSCWQKYVAQAKANGMRIAVVFRSREEIPAQFLGMECVDGDDSDVRHLDPQGVVVALYAKGKAKKDTSGFVVDTPRKIIPLKIAA